MEPNITFSGKVAIVTGGASGIGLALVKRLQQAGAIVYACDVDEKALLALAQTLPMVKIRVLDVTDAVAVEQTWNHVAQIEQRLDYVFNNAGIVSAGETQAVGLALWQKMISINEWGVIYGTDIAYKIMLKQGFGHIVNTTSVAGIIPVANMVPYTTAKFAVTGLSLSLREEARPHGIKVSIVIPGVTQTNIFAKANDVGTYNSEKRISKVPMHPTTPEQAAQFILSGVTKNKAMIAFPFSTKILLILNRIVPRLMWRIVRF